MFSMQYLDKHCLVRVDTCYETVFSQDPCCNPYCSVYVCASANANAVRPIITTTRVSPTRTPWRRQSPGSADTAAPLPSCGMRSKSSLVGLLGLPSCRTTVRLLGSAPRNAMAPTQRPPSAPAQAGPSLPPIPSAQSRLGLPPQATPSPRTRPGPRSTA